jgi:hypothetical protein
MVYTIPTFDLGEAFGGGLGQGMGNVLNQLGQRQISLQALNQLENLDPKDFQSKPLHQQLATLSKAYAGTPMQAVLPDLLSAFIKERGRLAGGPQGGTQPGQYPYEDILGMQGSKGSGGILSFQTQQPSMGGKRVSQDVEPYTSQEQQQKQQAVQVGQTPYSLPASFPGDLQKHASIFPNISALALRGNPQGIDQAQRASIVQRTMAAGGTAEQGQAEADRLDNYFREQAGLFQNLQNAAVNAIQNNYGNSTYTPTLQRAAQNEVERQINKGNLEPNSVTLAALQKAKDIEKTINTAPAILGRPNFELKLDSRKNASKQWISPLAKSGEYQTAIELLMKNKIPVQGGEVNGPDWGPVRASEIVQEEANKQGIQKEIKFAKQLPNVKIPEISFEERPEQITEKQALNRQANKLKGINSIAEFIATQMSPQDSLITLRYYATERGYSEDDFSRALQLANEINPNLSFSDYQNWEISNLLPLNIRPSLFELLNSKRRVSDLWNLRK